MKYYALKIMEISSAKGESDIITEIQNLHHISNLSPKPDIFPNFYGFSLDEKIGKKQYYLKFELKDGNLRKLISENKKSKSYFPFETLCQWLNDLIKGLFYLQTLKISHRDLKPENILYSKNNTIKNQYQLTITDFGESQTEISKDFLNTISVRGTILFMAPELRIALKINQSILKYNPFKADIFSLGIIFLELSTLKIPYDGNLIENMNYENFESGNYEFEVRKLLKEIFTIYEKKVKQKVLLENYVKLIENMMKVNPDERFDFFQSFQCLNFIMTKEELTNQLIDEYKQNEEKKKNKDEEKNITNIKKTSSFKEKNKIDPLFIIGCGEVVYKNKDRYFGQFLNGKKNGKGICDYSNGDRYEGDWIEDELDGYGEYLFNNGDRYLGEFTKSKRNGKGLFEFAGKGFYEGEWVNGFQENYGNFIFNNGDKYKGKFSKGLYHGRGILEYNDGNVYDGEWNNGVKEGYGKLIFKTGEKYEGSFKNDEFNGNGKLTLANGNKEEGIWKNGILIEKNKKFFFF